MIEAPDTAHPLVVSFYTPEYEAEARQLQATCDQWGVLHFIRQRASKGNWLANCAMKSEFLLECMEKWDRPLIWLDVDARVCLYPELLYDLEDFDFAAYFIPDCFRDPNKRPWGPDRSSDALAGGTMFFNTTDLAHELLVRCRDECALRPGRFEQQTLQMVLGHMLDEDSGIAVTQLPQSYCKVKGQVYFMGEEGPDVIFHTQASRRLKRTVR